eukprot:gene7250-14786_t
MTLESQVEQLCNGIFKKSAEFWEDRNKCMLDLTTLVLQFNGAPQEQIQDIFTPHVFRTLREAIKEMISDLRSQQVRDTCQFLITLAQVCGDHTRNFLRDSFCHILDGIKIPAKVFSGYVDECIISIIRSCTFKSGIPMIVREIKEHKAKYVRERCLEYIDEILIHWDVTDKDADLLVEGLKFGLEDASTRLKRVEAEMGNVPPVPVPVSVFMHATNSPSQHPKLSRNAITTTTTTAHNNHNNNYHNQSSNQLPMKLEVEAATSIQALLRGTLTRRHSVLTQKSDNSTYNNDTTTMFILQDTNSSSSNGPRTPVAVTNVGCKVVLKDRTTSLTGIVKFVGSTDFAGGCWVGLCLDAPRGKNNGKVLGKEYFSCPSNHGLFNEKDNDANTIHKNPITIKNIDSTPNKEENINESNINSTSIYIPNGAQTRVTGMLKLNISQMMDLLNQQLEIAEMMDSASSVTHSNILTNTQLIDTKDEILGLCEQQIKISSEFRNKLIKFFESPS